jgi:hypothetical protein
MRVELSTVACWVFVCAVIEPDRVEGDHYELLKACCEFSMNSIPRRYSTSPRTALQTTINAYLAFVSAVLVPALCRDGHFPAVIVITNSIVSWTME